MDRIFINTHGLNSGWIMQILAEDICRVAKSMGYECNSGDFDDYDGEEICYDFHYHIAVPISRAKHNSFFYSHLNDSLKESHLLSLKDKFDSFICMSPEDAEFLVELGFDPKKVFGRALPARNKYVKPIKIGIFSACYDDGRKNEAWLIDYCKTHALAQNAIFVFVGPRWGAVVKELDACGVSSEWCNISRKLPYEYQYQQNQLATLDYYIYMGMDGGAMGTYDAYSQDVPLCVTFDGFHKSIPNLDYTFDSKQGFIEQLDKILFSHKQRLDFFHDNSPEDYVKWLIDVWEGRISEEISEYDKKCISFENVLSKKRSQYYPLNFQKLKNYLSFKKYILKKSRVVKSK